MRNALLFSSSTRVIPVVSKLSTLVTKWYKAASDSGLEHEKRNIRIPYILYRALGRLTQRAFHNFHSRQEYQMQNDGTLQL